MDFVRPRHPDSPVQSGCDQARVARSSAAQVPVTQEPAAKSAGVQSEPAGDGSAGQGSAAKGSASRAGFGQDDFGQKAFGQDGFGQRGFGRGNFGGGPITPQRRVKPPKLYRIGEVVDYCGMSRQTIHNYTIMGLLHESKWTSGGHRLYDESVFERLDAIADLRSQNKSIDEILEHFAKTETQTAG